MSHCVHALVCSALLADGAISLSAKRVSVVSEARPDKAAQYFSACRNEKHLHPLPSVLSEGVIRLKAIPLSGPLAALAAARPPLSARARKSARFHFRGKSRPSTLCHVVCHLAVENALPIRGALSDGPRSHAVIAASWSRLRLRKRGGPGDRRCAHAELFTPASVRPLSAGGAGARASTNTT